MANIPLLKAAGLYRSNNEIGSAPEGALAEAKNVVIRSKDLVEPRRGFNTANQGEAAFREAVRTLFFYGNTLYAHGGSPGDIGTLARYDGLTSLSGPLGDALVLSASASRPNSFEAQNCLYFTSQTGVRKMDSTSSAHKAAGIPKPLNVDSLALDSSGDVSTHWLSTGEWVAYVYLFGTRDATGRFILGEPSSRRILGNTAMADRRSTMNLLLPTDVTTDHFLQIYRTAIAASEDALTGDYFQIGEIALTSSDLTTGYVSYTDTTPEGATNLGGLGRLGYFSANAEGIAEANSEPPLCVDAVLFGQRALYANTSLRHSFNLDILGVDPDSLNNGGLKPGDKIKIAGITFTAALIQNQAARQFLVDDGGGSDPYLAIYNTAKWLVDCINHNDGNGTECYAYQIAEETGSPGAIVIERQRLSGSSFVVRGSASTPDLPFPEYPGEDLLLATSPSLSPAVDSDSTNESSPNRIYFSKRDIPEAVPRKNYIPVGAKNKRILRLVVLRDRLYIFKEDGVFVLSGDMASARAYPLDPTVRLVAPDSVAVVANQVYALSTKGVVAVSDAGAVVVSKGIERELTKTLNVYTNRDNIFRGTWGCGYESERLYILGLAYSTTETSDLLYVYNVSSGAWSWWDIQANCAVVDPVKDVLYLGGLSDENLRVENKNFTNLDYYDGTTLYGGGLGVAVSGPNADGTYTFTNADMAAAVSIGDTILADTVGGTSFGSIIAINGSDVTMDPFEGSLAPTPTDGMTVTVASSYPCEVTWAAKAPGGPGAHGHVREMIVHFRDAEFEQAYAGLATDFSPEVEYRAVVLSEPAGFSFDDQRDWGENPIPTEKRVGVPPDKQRAKFYRPTFYIREALSMWSLQGITLVGDAAGEKGGK